MTYLDWTDCELDDICFTDEFLSRVHWKGFSGHILDEKGSLMLVWDMYGDSDVGSTNGISSHEHECSSKEDLEIDLTNDEVDEDEA